MTDPAAENTSTTGESADQGDSDQQRADDRGTSDIRTVAIQHIAQQVASQVPGTVAHSSGLGKLLGRAYPSADVDVRGSSTWIRLQIAVAWPTAVEDVADRARDQVREETARMSGTDVRRVDVRVHVLCADQVQGTGRRVA